MLGILLLLSFSLVKVGAAPTKRQAGPLPDYVLTYAPLSHFHSGEKWFSSEIKTHLEHVVPQIDFTNVADSVTLDTLNTIPAEAYLTSKDDVESNPEWLLSTANKPDASRHSAAPATIIAVQKEPNIVDAFYFYFYSYNYGPPFLGIHFGNHVGDWEHTMVRFVDGVPESVYLSAHGAGYAYTFDAVEKLDSRPVTYIATGSHANYGTAGRQEYLLPFGLLADETDAGPLWDVTLNFRGYWYDSATQTFTSAGGAGAGGEEQASETIDWLNWAGRWGDEEYPDNDPRQSCPLNIECVYVSGPTGPRDKNLGRSVICQDQDDCNVEDELRQARVSDEALREAGLGRPRDPM